jgi:hypothetical protein
VPNLKIVNFFRTIGIIPSIAVICVLIAIFLPIINVLVGFFGFENLSEYLAYFIMLIFVGLTCIFGAFSSLKVGEIIVPDGTGIGNTKPIYKEKDKWGFWFVFFVFLIVGILILINASFLATGFLV